MGDTKQALADAGLPSFTAMPVLGRGQGHGDLEKIRDANLTGEMFEYISEVPRLKAKRMITLVVTDDKKDIAVETIIRANRTNKSGDGKIFVVNALGSYAIHTGEAGDATLD
jgi:nitrogen regulatory protein PII 2